MVSLISSALISGDGDVDFGNFYSHKINTSGTPKFLEICLQCFSDISILYHLFKISWNSVSPIKVI